MIRHLLVRDILGLLTGHMTGGAVGVLVVMARREAGMAGKAAAAVVADAILRGH